MTTKFAIIRSTMGRQLYDVVKIDYIEEHIEVFDKGLTFEDAQKALKLVDKYVDIDIPEDYEV